MTYLRLVFVADEMRSRVFSGWPAEPQQCCAATPGQSSCVQLCAAVRAVRTWGGSARAPGGSHPGQEQGTAGASGQPSPGHPLASGTGGGCAGMWAGRRAHGELWHCWGRGCWPRGADMGTWAASQAGQTDQKCPHGPDRLWVLGKKL